MNRWQGRGRRIRLNHNWGGVPDSAGRSTDPDKRSYGDDSRQHESAGKGEMLDRSVHKVVQVAGTALPIRGLYFQKRLGHKFE